MRNQRALREVQFGLYLGLAVVILIRQSLAGPRHPPRHCRDYLRVVQLLGGAATASTIRTCSPVRAPIKDVLRDLATLERTGYLASQPMAGEQMARRWSLPSSQRSPC